MTAHSQRSTRSLTLPIEHPGGRDEVAKSEPWFVMLCAAVPVLLGESFVGLPGNDRAAALGACALAGALLPLVRTRSKGQLAGFQFPIALKITTAKVAGPRPGSETILLVEDDDNVRAMAPQFPRG